jgi:branched-chain amino acid transport system permease protein
MEYFYSLLAVALIYCMVSIAENVSVGWGGQFSVAQASVFGVGAYTWTISQQKGATELEAIVMVLAAGAIVGTLVALVAKDVAGDLFTIVTVALVVVVQSLAQNLGITGGFGGLFAIPELNVFGFTPVDFAQWVELLIPLTVMYLLVYCGLTSTRIGVVLKAVREDEMATASLGRSVAWTKVIGMATASCGTAFAGAVYAGLIGFIDPTALDLTFSLTILSGMLVGGLGNPAGVALGAIAVGFLPQLLTLLPSLPQGSRAQLLQVIYGLILLVFLIFRPQGLIPERAGGWSIARWTWRRPLDSERIGTPGAPAAAAQGDRPAEASVGSAAMVNNDEA